MEKIITVAIIDQVWKEHLRDMDDLKQSVQNAVYEQKDRFSYINSKALKCSNFLLARSIKKRCHY
jgi:preprotein translocase subunit SecA